MASSPICEPAMKYFVMWITTRDGRQFEYVYPGQDADTTQADVQFQCGDYCEVGEAREYFGGTWPNVTPED